MAYRVIFHFFKRQCKSFKLFIVTDIDYWLKSGTLFTAFCLFACELNVFLAALGGAWVHHQWVAFVGVVISLFVFCTPGEPFTGQRYSSSSSSSSLWDRKNQSCPLTISWRGVWRSRHIKTSRGGCHRGQPQVWKHKRELEPRVFFKKSSILCAEIVFWEHLVSVVRAGY